MESGKVLGVTGPKLNNLLVGVFVFELNKTTIETETPLSPGVDFDCDWGSTSNYREKTRLMSSANQESRISYQI